MINVLIADDHQIVLDGIQAFLQNDPDIAIVGQAHDGQAVLRLMEDVAVDVAVIDIGMPVMDGLETARRILRQYPATKIVLLTMHGDSHFIIQAMRLGVHGYIVKEKSKESLVGAIHCVYRGASYWPPDLIGRVTDRRLLQDDAPESVHLTDKEMEVLCLIGKGHIYKEIADQLGIAEVTVQTHSRNIRRKLGLSNVNQLVRYAIERGLV